MKILSALINSFISQMLTIANTFPEPQPHAKSTIQVSYVGRKNSYLDNHFCLSGSTGIAN